MVSRLPHLCYHVLSSLFAADTLTRLVLLSSPFPVRNTKTHARAQSRLVRAARISAAKAVFDACPESAFRDDFAACIFAGTTDPDAGVRSVAVGPTRVLYRRFLPGKHSAIFATLLSQLPPVVVSDDKVEVSLGDGGSEEKDVTEPEVVSASEQAFAKLSKGKSENVQR